MVDQHGSLVGILASGDRRFSEIIPSTKLEEVFATMNKKHSNRFFESGGSSGDVPMPCMHQLLLLKTA